MSAVVNFSLLLFFFVAFVPTTTATDFRFRAHFGWTYKKLNEISEKETVRVLLDFTQNQNQECTERVGTTGFVVGQDFGWEKLRTGVVTFNKVKGLRPDTFDHCKPICFVLVSLFDLVRSKRFSNLFI